MRPKPDTIAAIATAPGRGGVGVVRLSGVNLSVLMHPLVGRTLIPRHATFTPFLDEGGEVIDSGIALFFPSPNSYTGEDVIELQGHGGTAVLQMVLRRCLTLGARLAHAGEFTKRAFLNDKLDLVQAESVADLISASSEQAVRSAQRSLLGDFSGEIHRLVEQLIDLRMRVEATLDFPEEDVGQVAIERYFLYLQEALNQLNRVLTIAKQGTLLREGAHVVLIGQPNVGKSSLLNKLSGEEVALVSEVAGTTRDAIRQAITINGVPLHLIDTAGLRTTEDAVERMGIERTKAAIQKADLALVLMEAGKAQPLENQPILALIPEDVPTLFVINKIDLTAEHPRCEQEEGVDKVFLSAKSGEGITLLQDKILQLLGWRAETGVFMARERHLLALGEAKQSLQNAVEVVSQGELLAEELRVCQRALNQITGDFSNEDLLGEIFSRFCIGK